jgi:hypothetical protein
MVKSNCSDNIYTYIKGILGNNKYRLKNGGSLLLLLLPLEISLTFLIPFLCIDYGKRFLSIFQVNPYALR